jgi:hypothetical protein
MGFCVDELVIRGEKINFFINRESFERLTLLVQNSAFW